MTIVSPVRVSANSKKSTLSFIAAAVLAALSPQLSYAQQQEVQLVEQRAQALSQALVNLGQQFSVEMIVPEHLVAGKTAPAINGQLNFEQALNTLLRNQGLETKKARSGALIIVEKAITQSQPSRASGKTNDNLPGTDHEQETWEENIIIKGTKQGLSLQEVDASVEVFNLDRIEAERIVDLTDVLARIPNVSSQGGGSSFAIRGIARAGGAGQGVTSNVYIDGSPLSGVALGRGKSSLWDVAQIEVLRGSQSSVQGRNALAGAVVVTTADPTYYQEGKFRATYGSHNTYQVAGAYSAPIVDEQLAFRVALDVQESDGFIDHVLVDKNADYQERLLFRGKLLFEPKAIDDLSLKLTVDHNNTDTGESRHVVTTNFNILDNRFRDFDPFDYVSSGRYPQNDTETTRIILDTNYQLNDHWRVFNALTHEDTKVDRQFGFRDRVAAFGGFAFNEFDEKVLSAELRFHFDYGDISGLFGGYYFDSENDSITRNELLLAPELLAFGGTVTPADATLSLSSPTATDTKNYAFFGQVRWKIDTHWTLDLGLRYDDEEFNNAGLFGNNPVVSPDNCAATVPGALVGAPVPQATLPCSVLLNALLGRGSVQPAQEASYDAWLPKATLTYNFNDDHAVFVSAQRGYRAGGSFITRMANTDGVGNRVVVLNYEPEYLNTIEVGSRSEFDNGNLVLNTNAFHSTYKDQQISLPGEDASSFLDDIIDNAAKSTIYGLELSATYQLSQQWQLFASVGLLETEFDDFPFAVQGPFKNLAGNEQSQAPNQTVSLSADWQHPEGWFGNVSVFYSSESYSDVANLDNQDFINAFVAAGLPAEAAAGITEKVESTVDVTTRFGYELDDFTVYVYATNLLNQEAVTSANRGTVSPATGQIQLSQSITNSTVKPKRAFGIGIDYVF